MSEPRLIPLHAKDGSARAYVIVDASDYERLAQHRWCLSGVGYAMRRGPNETKIYMHRELLGLERGDPRQSDHINRVRTDNRRSNLRIVTGAQNSHNVKPRFGGSSRYRGVCWNGKRKKWAAYGIADGRQIFLGHFGSEEDAAQCAREWRELNLSHYVEEAAI